MEDRDYRKVFETLVTKTGEYIKNAGLKTMVLGISGGIDSTVVAAICSEVEARTGIPLIGRSLPTKFNKSEEVNTAVLVGEAFCEEGNFEECSIKILHDTFISFLKTEKYGMTPLANGNIQARLRMNYLFYLAGVSGGIVMDTDNMTENNLGYWTIFGDQGLLNPIGDLWKTEVFKFAEFLVEYYKQRSKLHSQTDLKLKDLSRSNAISESLKLKPTAGLGITDSDLEELGADSYEQVDTVLKEILSWREFVKNKYTNFEDLKSAFWKTIENAEMISPETPDTGVPWSIYKNITKRHFASEFKRQQLPVKIKL